MSLQFLESLKDIFEWGSVGLVLATFLCTFGLVVTTRKINKIQAEELRQFQLRIESEQQKTAKAQKEAADTQLALKSYVDMMAKSINDRHLDSKRFIELLNGRPKGTAEISYEPDEAEAQQFAFELHRSLGPDGAGWKVLDIKPISAGTISSGGEVLLDTLRKRASTGIAVM